MFQVIFLLFSDGYDRFQFDVKLSVENDLDGTYGQNTILFRIHDSREDFGIDIEDEQHFEIGERVLVFIGGKEPDSVMGDAYLVYGVTQGKYLLKNGIAFGNDFPEGISEDELILKIQNLRTLNFSQNEEFTDEQICGEGHVLTDGICIPKSIWDSSDFRGLQTGETISNPEVAIILESLGAILIVLFIVIYAVKKRMKKSIEEKK